MVMLKPWDLWELRHWAAPDRLANSKVISADIQEKPLLDTVFLLFSNTEIEGGYLCRQCRL